MDVDRLRAETRPEHERTEATVPLMSGDLTLAQYAGVLRRIYRVIAGWEAWATAHSPASHRHLLEARKRSGLITADLAFLAQPSGEEHSAEISHLLTNHLLDGDVERLLSAARFLGAMYVIEGSTLGGQYIAKHVEERFGFEEGRGDAYFRGYGERTGSMWRSFKGELLALADTDADEVIAAARAMFAVFAAGMEAPESPTAIAPLSLTEEGG